MVTKNNIKNIDIDEPVRINKYLSDAGVCSRREADRLIEAGKITVDGKKSRGRNEGYTRYENCV